MKKVILILALFLTSPSWASSQESESQSNQVQEIKSWVRGSQSVVKLKGQADSGGLQCSDFEIKMEKQLTLQIDCGDFSQARILPLENGKSTSVTRNKGFITITSYGYMLKNPQVSATKQTTLKVPYVEEIIHLKISKNGDLAFYLESFKVDEFGRIVQDQFVQAHSLVSKKIKISKVQ